MTQTCIAPPGLDDTQLLAYLDGVGDRQTIDHLKVCSSCRSRAQRFQRMETTLAALLYRVTCPSPMELGEYHLGGLKRGQAKGISLHLAECPRCAREVAQLSSYLGNLAPAPEPDLLEQALEQVRVRVGQLVSGAAGLLSAPQLAFAPVHAGVRGGGAGPAVYEADDVQVMVDAERSAGAADRFVLSGHFVLLGLITGVEPAGWTAHLWQGDRLVATEPVDEGGNFVFESLASAPYELVLSGPGQEIYIEELRI